MAGAMERSMRIGMLRLPYCMPCKRQRAQQLVCRPFCRPWQTTSELHISQTLFIVDAH